ncbi:MAG: endonuclease/exonuclease/phosphatase family protein [Planctomycetota bacterium]
MRSDDCQRSMLQRSLTSGVRMAALWLACFFGLATSLLSATEPNAKRSIRIATFNVSLYGRSEGQIASRLSDGRDQQAEKIAKIVQAVRPDILLLNEIDYEPDHASVKHVIDFLASGEVGIEYSHFYSAPSNTGIASGLDLNGDGKVEGPNDAWGYGVYPGQYSMAVLSRYPIDQQAVRTFQKFRWTQLAGAIRPTDPQSDQPFYSDEVWNQLRLSSKNHVDVPIQLPGDRVLHVLASHPTPPVFDGPEDRNGARNHDEIKFWNEYLSDAPETEFVDDNGQAGPLGSLNASFVILGDLNSDPADGDSRHEAIANLLNHPRVQDPKPRGDGGAESAKQHPSNKSHQGDPSFDTAFFGRNGNLRVDYVLPSKDFQLTDQGVFWPATSSKQSGWLQASDHRMVWVEVQYE